MYLQLHSFLWLDKENKKFLEFFQRKFIWLEERSKVIIFLISLYGNSMENIKITLLSTLTSLLSLNITS